MKICRFNGDRIGVVADQVVHDVTDLFNRDVRWPQPPGDPIMWQMPARLKAIRQRVTHGGGVALSAITLNSPVANPGKIIGAPINYKSHIEEANADAVINNGKTYTSIDKFGLFLKASSSLVGPESEIQLSFPDRRNDHEVELALIIGKTGRFISPEDALDYVFGYTIGLDMTIRGPEFPSFRKSLDTFAVLGPWITTHDEIADPNALDLSLKVNGEVRQASNSRHLIFDVQALIAYASRFYTLHPGDIIMTGTPDGVGPVVPGDRLEASVEGLGTLSISVAPNWVGPPV